MRATSGASSMMQSLTPVTTRGDLVELRRNIMSQEHRSSAKRISWTLISAGMPSPNRAMARYAPDEVPLRTPILPLNSCIFYSFQASLVSTRRHSLPPIGILPQPNIMLQTRLPRPSQHTLPPTILFAGVIPLLNLPRSNRMRECYDGPTAP